MADEPDNTEKTEEPTQKRLDEALQRGDVVKSQEVNTWFVIAGATLVLMAFSGGTSSELTTTMRGLIANAHNISMDGPALPRLFEKIGVELIAAVAIPFLLLMLAALGGNLIQHRLVLVAQGAGAQAVQDFAGRRIQAAVLRAGVRQFRQGPRQAYLGAYRHRARSPARLQASDVILRSARRVRWCRSDAGKPRRQDGKESRPTGGQAPNQASSGRQTGAAAHTQTNHSKGTHNAASHPKSHTRHDDTNLATAPDGPTHRVLPSPEGYVQRLEPQGRSDQYGGRSRRNRSAVAYTSSGSDVSFSTLAP